MNDSTPKLWYQSRTIWLSIAGILTAFAIAFLEVVVRAGDDVTWATIAAAALAGFGALNIYLRFGTHQALTINTQQASVGGTQTNIARIDAADDALLGSTQTEGNDPPVGPGGRT